MLRSWKSVASCLSGAALVGLVSWASGSAASGPAPEPKAATERQAEKAPAKKPPAVVIDASEFPSLQAAFDAVPEAGGLVKLPPGDFELTSPLVLSRGNTRVVGAGAATRLINGNREGQPALIVRPPELEKNPKARLWRVQLADFRINGDPDTVDARSTKPKSGDGLLAQNIDEIYVHGMSIDHNGGHGINLIHCHEDPRVSDCILTYNAQAGLNIVVGHDIVVSANQFEENQDAVRCTDSFNLCMSGNNLDDHLGNGVVIENTYGSVLSGNMIEECQKTAIILDRDCYGITISANVLADNFGGGVDLRDAWGCAVSANTFTIDAVRALVVGPKSGRITITGNNFSDSYIGEKTRREGRPNLATGIILQGTSDIVISGNLFSGLSHEAVRADADCRRIAVTGNVVVDVNRAVEQPTPALDLGEAQETVCADNILQQSDEPAEPSTLP